MISKLCEAIHAGRLGERRWRSWYPCSDLHELEKHWRFSLTHPTVAARGRVPPPSFDLRLPFWPPRPAGRHIPLGKDAPCTRPIERFGDMISRPILNGRHHRYADFVFGSDRPPGSRTAVP